MATTSMLNDVIFDYRSTSKPLETGVYTVERIQNRVIALTDLHPQDQLILIEALTYWAYDISEEFDRSDPRRNRAIELAEELLRNESLPENEFPEIVDPDWSGPTQET